MKTFYFVAINMRLIIVKLLFYIVVYKSKHNTLSLSIVVIYIQVIRVFHYLDNNVS